MSTLALYENIFNLNMPEAYDCYVERYHSSLHVLRLRAVRMENTPPSNENMLEFVFTDVLYFNGTLNWSGANICIAPREECFKILDRAAHFDNADEEDVQETLDTYHLYTIFTNANVQVKFVAHNNDFTLNVMA